MEPKAHPWGSPLRFEGWAALILLGSSLILISSCSGDSSAYVTKFGCNFYAPGASSAPKSEKYTEIARDSPIFGNHMKPLQLNDERELRALIDRFTQVYKHMYEQFSYNSLDKFLRFHEDYKNTPGDFKTFFRNYRPKFHSHESCIGMSVEVLDQAHYKLKDRWPQLAQHTFIVASKTDMPKKWASDLEEVYGEMFAKKGVDYALMTKGIPHTLSAIFIEVKGRRGYILGNIGDYWERPAVLMVDEKPPHDAVIEKLDTENFLRFSFVLNNTHVMWKTSPPNGVEGPRIANLVYLRPFCSFQEITEKASLLIPVKAVIARDRDAKLKGGFFVRIHNPLGWASVVLLYKYVTEAGESKKARVMVPLVQFLPLEYHNLSEGTRTLSQIVAQVVGLTHAQFLGKLRRLEYIMTTETNFLFDVFDAYDDEDDDDDDE